MAFGWFLIGVFTGILLWFVLSIVVSVWMVRRVTSPSLGLKTPRPRGNRTKVAVPETAVAVVKEERAIQSAPVN